MTNAYNAIIDINRLRIYMPASTIVASSVLQNTLGKLAKEGPIRSLQILFSRPGGRS